MLGMMAGDAGRLDEAERALKKALELNPGLVIAHKWLGLVYMRQGRLPEALEEMQREPAPFWQRFGLALVYHALGRQEEADATLTELIKNYQDVAAYQIASIYAYRGEVDKPFEWLERAYRQRDGGLADFLMTDQLLITLHSDPRWGAFLKKMKLDG